MANTQKFACCTRLTLMEFWVLYIFWLNTGHGINEAMLHTGTSEVINNMASQAPQQRLLTTKRLNLTGLGYFLPRFPRFMIKFRL